MSSPHATEAVVAQLRRECPYNARQEAADLLRALQAEVEELAVAIRDGADWEIEEELGDVLFSLASLAAALAQAHGLSLRSADARAARKMIGRHPYVFGDEPDPGPEEAARQWAAAKLREARERVTRRAAVVATGVVDVGDAVRRPAGMRHAARLLAGAMADASGPVSEVREDRAGVTVSMWAVPGSRTLAFTAVGGADTDPESLRARMLTIFHQEPKISLHEVAYE